jgi:hypothetical protein
MRNGSTYTEIRTFPGPTTRGLAPLEKTIYSLNAEIRNLNTIASGSNCRCATR